MQIADRVDFESLADYQEEICISIYMPTVQVGPETQENPIRLKNLLAEASERLRSADYGLAENKIDALLEPAKLLVDDHEFWAHQGQGLAIFLADDDYRTFKLPTAVSERVVINERYNLRPLLPLLSGNQTFYLLALSQGDLRVFKGDRYEIAEITPDEMPDSLSDALKWDDPEMHLDWHTKTQTPGSEAAPVRDAIFHGGGVEEQEKERILQYFHQVDRGMQQLLGDSEAPLLLAGVDYLPPIYREANEYPHLLEQGIEGSPKVQSAKELHEQAVATLRPVLDQEREEALADFQRLVGSDQTSTDLSEIVTAAHYGRVKVLFAAKDAQQRGSFDRQTGKVHLNGNESDGLASNDLIYLAALQTYLNSGKVYVTESDTVPGENDMAAILRY